jgi:hypothetical protein
MIFRLYLAASLAAVCAAAQPRWLTAGGEYRARWEGLVNRGFAPGETDTYLLNRFRMNLELRPAPWFRLFFQGQDARVLGNTRVSDAPPLTNHLDLRQGYLEFRTPDNDLVSLRAGRQEMNFGDQRLFGSVNWANASRSFDAVRLTLRHKHYRLDAFAASVVNLRSDGADRSDSGNNIHGLYGGIENLLPGGTIEPYIFWRLRPRVLAEAGTRANLDVKTLGVRCAGKLPASLDYNIEMAGQAGSLGPDRVRAWAGHWNFGRTLTGRWTPRVSGEYNFATGDEDPRDGRRGTFDVLYVTAHDKWGMADQVGWRNIHHLRSGVECRPRTNLRLLLNYHTWWLVSARDGLYAANGTLLVAATDGTAGTHVGQEVDLQGAYSLSRQVTILGGIGRLFPGGFLEKTTPGKALTFPFVSVGYTF